MTDGIMGLFEGVENLSEDFKGKVQTIFEAAVSAKVQTIREEIEADNAEKLQEQAEAAIADMEQKVDQFLTYVAEEWVDKNELAIEKGITAELSESFLGGLKTLFEEHYVEVPEEKVDVVAEMASTIEDLEDEKNDAVNENVTLRKQVADYTKDRIVAEVTASFADTEKDKLMSLIDDIEFVSEDVFRDKLSTICENFLGKTINEGDDEDADDDDDDKGGDDDKKDKKDKKKNPFVKESKDDGAETKVINESVVDPTVASYANAIGRKSSY